MYYNVMEILIAEDEKDISFGYKEALEERGHSVVITSNGEECLKVYNKRLKNAAKQGLDTSQLPFDVVILDYKMPKKNGLQVTKEIFSVTPKQRVIFASAYVKYTLEESLKELEQIVEVMQKPFDVRSLIDTIEDREISDGLNMLMSSLKGIKRDKGKHARLNPTQEQIRDLFEGLRKIQKGRTF
jgi:CheY-like chemotaxis protein